MNDTFVIPVGELWGVENDRVRIVYDPLQGHLSIADPTAKDSLKPCPEGKFESFQAKGAVPVHRLPDSPHDLYQIDILANYTCNFKCIYCYSAKGRSTRQIEFDRIKAVINYLFCSGKEQKRPYIINFSGGGEPLLSFEQIKRTVEYIREVSAGKGYRYNIGLVTNGSLITPEIIDYFQDRKVDMAVSFEILERLQNKERGSYDKVAANIDMMLARGFPFGVRTTFTPESVSTMCEMIETASTRFPKLRRIVFDTVLAPSLFPTPESLALYYDTFLEEYYKAKKLGAGKGISVESTAVEMLSMVRDRTCGGKISLTPMGTVSCCSRISSPNEPLYDDYVYGRAQDGELRFDEDKFREIMASDNIYSQDRCAGCFARWNCGGGCRLFRQSFGPEYGKVQCEFTRKSLVRQLLSVLSDSFGKRTGGSLHDFISEKLRKSEP